MDVQQIEPMDAYVKFPQQTPAEVEALFRDLLIGVTNFFRDAEAFKALEEQAIPRLFAGKTASDLIRVWAPGCSTGEEAYSIAILLQERLEALKQSFTLQIFATDIDSHAIAAARLGIFPASIAADLSPGAPGALLHARARRQRLPHPQEHPGPADLLRAGRDQGSALLEARPHQLPQPPHLPGAGAAEEAHPPLPLRPQPGRHPVPGHLGVRGGVRDLFSAIDRKHKLYQRKDEIHGGPPRGPEPVPRRLGARRARPCTGSPARPGRAPKMPLRELTEQTLLQQPAAGRSSTPRATSSTSTAAPALPGTRLRARPASTTS